MVANVAVRSLSHYRGPPDSGAGDNESGGAKICDKCRVPAQRILAIDRRDTSYLPFRDKKNETVTRPYVAQSHVSSGPHSVAAAIGEDTSDLLCDPLKGAERDVKHHSCFIPSLSSIGQSVRLIIARFGVRATEGGPS